MKLRLAALAAIILLSACRHAGDLTTDNGGGVYAVRSDCPIAGIPAGTGDVTLFNPPNSIASTAIDVTAAITDLRATCQDTTTDVVSTATFTVVALRRDAGPARQIVLPYFDVALRGGTEVAAKQVGQIVLNFPAGNQHTFARVQAVVRSQSGCRCASGQRSTDPYPSPEGRRSRRRGRPAGRSSRSKGCRERHVRASDRLPAHAGSAEI